MQHLPKKVYLIGAQYLRAVQVLKTRGVYSLFGRKGEDFPDYRTRIGRYPTSRMEDSSKEWFRGGLGNMVRMFGGSLPREFGKLVKDTSGPKGDVRERVGPYVYGFSYTFTPGEEPVFQEFGDIRPSYRSVRVAAGRKPLVDVRDEGDRFKITVELPGVDKKDIRLDADEDSINIETVGDRAYHSRVGLNIPVNPASARASCKNGILEIEVEKQEEFKPQVRQGTRISIE